MDVCRFITTTTTAVASGDDGDTASEGEEDGVGLRELETHHTDKRKLFAAARQYSSSRSIHAEVVVGTGVRLDVLKRRAFNYRWATVPEGVLPLTAASSDYPAPPAVVAALQAHVEDAYFSYGPNEGLPEFREAAAAYFSDRVARGAAACGDAAAIGDRYDAALVCATNAAAAAIYAVAAATLRPGDECLVMAPVDFLLDRSVRAAGATVVRYDVRARGRRGDARPTFDVDELDRLAEKRPRQRQPAWEQPGEEGGAKLAYVLMPLIDAFNHADFPEKTEFEFSASAFRLRSPARVSRDQEIFISYGALGNDELLTRYGFVADEAPANDTYVYQGLAAWLDANHEPARRAKGADPARAEKISCLLYTSPSPRD